MFTEHVPRCRNRARPRDKDSGHGFVPRCSAVRRTGRTASRHLPVRPRRADNIQCAFGGGTVPSSFWFFFIFFKWVVHCHNDIFYLKIYDLYYIFFALPFSHLIPPAPSNHLTVVGLWFLTGNYFVPERYLVMSGGTLAVPNWEGAMLGFVGRGREGCFQTSWKAQGSTHSKDSPGPKYH